MDDKQREERRDYVEDAEDLREERRDEEMRAAREIYSDDEDTFMEERKPTEAVEPQEVHPDEADRYRQEREREEVRASGGPVMEKGLVPLLDERQAQDFREHWQDIQTEFVDDPQNSVERADELVTRVINSITENFASERTALEDQWNRGEEASTEDLRLAMKRYRSFFNRLLTLELSETAE